MRLPRSIIGGLIAALALALPFAPGALAKDKETREERDARKTAEKELKKSGKKLAAALKALSRASDDDARSEIRDKAVEFLREMEAINHYVVADTLLDLGPVVEDELLYDSIADSLSALTEASIPEHLTERFGSSDKKASLSWQQKVMVLDAYRKLSGPATVKATALGLRDEHPAVRRAAVTIAPQKEDKAVVEALIDLLGLLKDDGGVTYFAARQALVDLTGQDFMSHEKWKAWWDSNKDGFDFSAKGEAKEARTVERKEDEVPRFFGTEIKSNRCIFIMDVSGSMQMTDPPESWDKSLDEYQKLNPDPSRQRIERAKVALAKVIKTLQPTQFFNIFRYSSAVQPWQSKDVLVPATEANKADALKFIETTREGGGTETYQALARAFEKYDDIDTIYLLSDGAPSPGKLGNPGEQQQSFEQEEIDRIINWVKLNNRFRRIKIFTFGFDGPGAYHKKWGPRSVTLPMDPKFISHFGAFMRELAGITGGEYESLK